MTKMTYAWEVVDGHERRPMGYIGRYATKDEARKAQQQKCRMGGYVKRILVPKAKV